MSIHKLILNLILSLGLSVVVAIFFLYLIFIAEMFIAGVAQCRSLMLFSGIGLERPVYSETNLICKILFEYGGTYLLISIPPVVVGIGSFVVMVRHFKRKGYWIK
jgi:hypothetical protein